MIRQADFQVNYIWWGLRLAVFAGFALGAHVISVIGFSLPLGKGYYGYIQAHGHIQLVGWAGLFVLGISLHFIPRLAGYAIEPQSRLRLILHSIVAGLILRFLGHSVLAYLTETWLFQPLSWLIVLSGALVLFGCATYVLTLVQTIRRIPDIAQRPALKAVKPFFMMMFAGWLIYPVMNLAMLIAMTVSGDATVNNGWNESAVQIFTNFVLLPVAFAFSVRLFPLFLRLPAIDWAVGTIAATFLVGASLQIAAGLPPFLALETNIPLKLSGVGMLLKGIVILVFIWKLDVLTRRRAPWTVLRVGHPDPSRPATRPGLPDYGEFGAFEKLLYFAYGWLAFGALMEAASGLSLLFGFELSISTDAIRHAYVLGFITQLILGMAVRMLPGFLGKKRVARPQLVIATFWLVNIAAASRVLTLIIPADWVSAIPGALIFSQSALGLSGIFGLTAVALLFKNLRDTASLQD